jgi:hypothetical protein
MNDSSSSSFEGNIGSGLCLFLRGNGDGGGVEASVMPEAEVSGVRFKKVQENLDLDPLINLSVYLRRVVSKTENQ